MLDFLLGVFVGFSLVGSSVQRTICVGRGEVFNSFVLNSLSSLFYYISVSFVATDNFTGFLGTCLGSTIVISWLAINNKRKGNVYKSK